MNWLELAGYLFAFFGTVFLGAGLLKSEEQIKDEEATYWNGNPYKLNGVLKSQPYYRSGFRFLIAAFSINISFSLGKIYNFNQLLLVSLLISATVSSLGFIILQWFEKKQEVAHRAYKTQLIDNTFFVRLKHIYTEVKGQLAAGTAGTIDYATYKNNIVSELSNSKNFVQDIYVAGLNQLVNDLESATDFSPFYVYLEDYLKSQNII